MPFDPRLGLFKRYGACFFGGRIQLLRFENIHNAPLDIGSIPSDYSYGSESYGIFNGSSRPTSIDDGVIFVEQAPHNPTTSVS